MAYVNVKDWSVDQVTEWIKGLDNIILQYAKSFLNNGVTGHQLLNLRSDDLEHLGVRTLGHQEIILEAVEHLRNFHYELDKENLQMLALKLSCAANSLFKELLLLPDSAKISNQVMTDIHNIVTIIKPLFCWLDGSPFADSEDYVQNKKTLLQLSFEMATTGRRDIFSQQPVTTIRNTCEELSKMADYIIQEMSDPIILQPASLDLATLKKKEQELGIFLSPCNHAIHQIHDIKKGSPAHNSSKIEKGDEIVQVNYQTVVGWQRKKVVMLIQESPPEIVLTLKKRPRHTKVYGQIYMKPYRLPSRKRNQNWSRWNDNLPSPRILHELPPLNIPKLPQPSVTVKSDVELSSSDSEPPDSPLDGEIRMYPSKPRPILQRRNTITGATPTSKRPYPPIEQYWEQYPTRAPSTHSSAINIDGYSKFEESGVLRDKSISFNVGLDLSPRPTTVIGCTKNPSFKKSFKDKKNTIKKRVNFEDKTDEIGKEYLTVESNLNEEKSLSANSLTSLNNEDINFIDEGRELTDRTSMTSDWKQEIVEEIIESIKMKPQNTLSENISPNNTSIKDIIKRFDEQKNDQKQEHNKPKVLPRAQGKKPPEVPTKPKPQVPPRAATTKLRGKLDKSHSTPAYDLTEEEDSNLGKFVIEKKLNKLPDVVPKMTTNENRETAIVIEAINPNIIENEPVTFPIKVQENNTPFTETIYELGIPIVEIIPTTPKILKNDITKSQEFLNLTEQLHEDIQEDLPPKPPPRNLDIPKPAYPSDSPKPQNLLDLAKNHTPRTENTRPVFEFPEPPKIEHIRQPSNSSVDVGIQSTGTIMGKMVYEDKPPKFFDPKVVSTPLCKSKMDFNEADTAAYKGTANYESTKSANFETAKNYEVQKSSSNYEIQKGLTETKVSPTNSIVKAMISNKGKSKKKNTLTAKRRKVSVNDLSPPDHQGFLFQRLRGKQNQNVHWEKRWFVLLGNSLYGFKNKEDPRAACLIFLSGYTVAVANEVKSKSNAFKVYHTGTVFYFSADDAESLQQWIELIRTATLHNETVKTQENIALYSETDESDSEKPKSSNAEKSDAIRKFGSLKKFGSKKTSNNDNSSQSGSTSLDRKWFFHKSTSSSSTKGSPVPVPTAQYQSYRKFRPNDVNTSVTTDNFTSHVPLFSHPNLLQSQNISVPNLTIEHVPVKNLDKPKLAKTQPINYIHASNPSLCNVNEFHNVPSFPMPKKSPSKTMIGENLTGFMTLEQLMIKQNEERKLNPHIMAEEMAKNFHLIKPDVVYGEVPIRPKEKVVDEKPPESPIKPTHSRQSSSSSTHRNDKHDHKPDKQDTSCFGKRLGSLKKSHHKEEHQQDFESKTATYPKSSSKNYDPNTKIYEHKLNRSLPRQHKMQETYTPFDEYGQKYTSEKSVFGGKNCSYEMIRCPETTNDVHFAQNRTLDDRMYHDTPKKGVKSKEKEKSNSLKYTSKVSDSSKMRLKSVTQYTPMSLPLGTDPKSKAMFAFELNLDEKSQKSCGKLNKFFGNKSDGSKKTLFGSPKLHRAFYNRKNDSKTDLSWPSTSPTPVPTSESQYSLENSPPTFHTETTSSVNISPQADYPGMLYPPVFEAETYSLADPQSLMILKKSPKDN